MRLLLLFAASLALPFSVPAQMASSRVVASLADSTFWPEGVDADPRTGSFYVASVRHRTIAEVRRDGTVHDLLARDRADLAPIFGVRVDTARNALWATMSGYPQISGSDTTRAALLEIRISDGALIRRWDIPPEPRGHVLGDLAIGPQGDVYFSDSVQPMLYILHQRGDSVTSIHSALFRSLQGLAPSRDGRWLYLTDYSTGLLRVSLADLSVERVIDVPGFSSHGCDGIVLYGNSIIAVQNGVRPARVVRFDLALEGDRITRATILDQNFLADEPTIGTIRDGEFVYVANSQWEKFGTRGERVWSRALTPPILLGVPLH